MKTSTITGEYIKDMITKSYREDGRKMFDYRPINLKIGTMPNAEGSAEASIGQTRVLAGIKIDVAEPMADKPEEGNLMTAAELLPLASGDYETGPPGPEAIELARVVDRGIRAANVVDMGKLFIEKDKVWSVFVDLYVLNYDGNLFDASSLAASAALLSSRMPKYEKEGETGKVVRSGNLGKLPTANIVTSCTFGNILHRLILDPTANEELFIDSRLTIANDEHSIRAVQKGLNGAFSFDEIDEMMDTAFEKSRELRQIIKKAIGE